MTMEEIMRLIIAIESVDELELYSWTRPQLDALRNEFYQSGWPTADFPIWIRKRFVEQASPTPPLPCVALTQEKESATRSHFIQWMYQLAGERLQ